MNFEAFLSLLLCIFSYDEAFPPLSALSDDGELNLVVSSWQSAKRPADPSVYSFAPSPINFLDSSSPDRNTIGNLGRSRFRVSVVFLLYS